MTADPLPPGARTAGRVAAWLVAAVLAVAVAAGAWVAVRGMLAVGQLREAEATARAVTAQLDDPAAAAAALDQVAARTGTARELTGDPVWRAAESLPWAGEQLRAVRVAIGAADDLAATALQPLVASGTLDPGALRPVDGRFDVAALQALAAPAAASADAAAAAAASLDTVDDDALLAPVAEQLASLRRVLGEAAGATDALRRATAVLPAALGAGGPRDYLVVFQNNAEWRSLGGIVGALAVVRTDGGAISLAAQGSSSDFTSYPDSVLPLSDEQRAIFDTKPGRWIQNVTQLPAFGQAAPLARELWARESGSRPVDGVVSVDPVALSYLLRATGPVPLPSGDTLTADTAVPLLLNEVYQRYENPADQDAFFQQAAAAVFAAFASGSADPAVLIEALAQAGAEHRLLVWSADPAEQAVLDGTTLQGALPVTDAATTGFGVYLNDGTGSKMDYYAAFGATAGWCPTPGTAAEAALTVTIAARAPADAASLPRYITGGGAFEVPPGVTRTVAYLYLPAGAELVFSQELGPASAPGFASGTDQGRQVLIWTTELAPGEQATAAVRVRTPATEALTVRSTPVIPGSTFLVEPVC